MKSVNLRTLAGVCLFTAASTAWATQPETIDVTLQSKLALRGSSMLHVINNTRDPLTMEFVAGPLGSIRFRTQRAMIGPLAAVDVNLGPLTLPVGNQIFHVMTTVNPGANQFGGPSLHEIFAIDRNTITPTSFERAYLERRTAFTGESRPLPFDIGGGYMDAQPMGRFAWPSASLPSDAVVEKVSFPSTFELARLPLRHLPEPGGASSAPLTGKEGEDGAEERDASVKARAMAVSQQMDAGIFGSIKGNIALKVLNVQQGFGSTFTPAWSWKVRAWQQIGDIYIQIGGTVAASDGSWSIDYLIPPFPNSKVRIDYQPANRFVQVQDANANVYTWGDNWDQTGKVTNIGNRVIDLTPSGYASGIDAIYQSANALWRKFSANGMSALRDTPIEITYPNTLATNKCQSTDNNNNTIPWSCSYADDGKIWLIQKHAVAGVVQHESAHSIHSYYWNGNMPSGGGIKHSRTKCYNPGLALTEGFADFMPYWVQFSPSAVSPIEPTLNFNIETPGAGTCPTASNETRVAATFWDTYDTHKDGVAPVDDDWNFVHPYAPISIFLNHPGHNSMSEYINVFSSILGPAWTSRVFDLFLLNTTII